VDKLPIPFNTKKNPLESFCLNPTLANYRRLKTELNAQGLTVEQAFPDLAAFLAWKGKQHLYKHILEHD
jgi:hypothetical protein